MDLEKLLITAEEAARAAGEIARERFGRPHVVTVKGFRDLVTDTDLAAQEVVTQIIRSSFPKHGFLTEEEDSSLPSDGPVIWIIDPIDGTTNFSRNIPAFCVSIAAVQNKQPLAENNILAGVIYDPMRDEMFSSSIGGANELNGQTLRTSKIKNIKQALIGHDWNRDPDIRQATLDSVTKLTKDAEAILTFGTAALALAWVAAGRLDGYFNYSLKSWDMAAANLMIRQAGGRMNSLSGPSLDFSTSKNAGCFATNSHLHEQLLAYMSMRIEG